MKLTDIVKSIFDYTVAAVFIITISPLLAAIALAIRMSVPGPIVFRQRRIGKDLRVFVIYKFRTMVEDSPDLRNPDGSALSAENDPRLTSIGRILRRNSLDELPQLFNVLHGDMSLVGPRPELPDGIASYKAHHFLRLTVKPGITGWAVIHGRNAVPAGVRRDLDVWYAEHKSLWLDLKIILKTVLIVVTREGINSTVVPHTNVRL
jgi:lipopolysaccharide/colanic/teichoic acid biosynthesis glycosyltransferase